MSQATSSSAGGGDGGANIELGATLLLTTTGNSKYTRIWRRSLYIRFLISVKKPTTSIDNHESPPSLLSSVPYTSLPPARTSSSVAIDIKEEETEEHIRRDIARIVKEKDLRSLGLLGGVDSVSAVLCRQHQHSKVYINLLPSSYSCPFLQQWNKKQRKIIKLGLWCYRCEVFTNLADD